MSFQYNKGEYVKYSSNGVCLVKDIQKMNFGSSQEKELNTYYILTPISNYSTKIFVPTENETLTSKMRRLLTKEELDSIISNISIEEIAWKENRKERIEDFQGIISRGDPMELLRLVSCIYLRKQQIIKSGKKFSLTDESFLQQAEGMIENEFAFVLGIEPFQVKDYIFEKIKVSAE